MLLLSHHLPTSFFTIDFTASLTERQFSVNDWTKTKYLLKILNSQLIFWNILSLFQDMRSCKWNFATLCHFAKKATVVKGEGHKRLCHCLFHANLPPSPPNFFHILHNISLRKHLPLKWLWFESAALALVEISLLITHSVVVGSSDCPPCLVSLWFF